MSILKKAGELGTTKTILVIGEPSSGKTSRVIQELLNLKVTEAVWLSLNNAGALSDNPDAENWAVAQLDSWGDVLQIVHGIVAGDIKGEAVVIDGLSVLAALALPEQPTQSDWGVMGSKVRDVLVTLRNNFKYVFVIVDVLKNDEQLPQIALNRDLYNKVISIFAEKWYCYTVPEEINKKKTGKVAYLVQFNGAMALRLKSSINT